MIEREVANGGATRGVDVDVGVFFAGGGSGDGDGDGDASLFLGLRREECHG